jgi:hypothetical protein
MPRAQDAQERPSFVWPLLSLYFSCQAALDGAERHDRTAVHALTALRLFAPTAFVLDQFRPPWIGAALARAHRVDVTAIVVSQKRAATVVPQADAGRVGIDTHQIASPKPVGRQLEEIADGHALCGAGFDVVIRTAGAARTAAGAFKTEAGFFIEHVPPTITLWRAARSLRAPQGGQRRELGGRFDRQALVPELVEGVTDRFEIAAHAPENRCILRVGFETRAACERALSGVAVLGDLTAIFEALAEYPAHEQCVVADVV